MNDSKRVLILGGTNEASQLARHLADDYANIHVILSVARPMADPPANIETKVGGFGGADGLADYIARERIDILVDATPDHRRSRPRSLRGLQR